MVDGHSSDQQNRPKKKVLAIAPQFLQGEKRRDHRGSRGDKPRPDLFIGRVTRFVISREGVGGMVGGDPTVSPFVRRSVRTPATHPTDRRSQWMRTTGVLDIPSARGPWWFLSSRENSQHDPG